MSFWSNVARLFVIPADKPAGGPAPDNTEQRASLDRPGTPLDAASLGSLYFTSKAGVVVDENRILSIPAFWRAVKILSGVIASLPLEVIEEGDDNTENVVRRHPVSTLLRNPSNLYSRYNFFETLIVHLYAHGNFYAIIKKKVGRPAALQIVDKPQQVTAKINARGDLLYEIDNQTYASDRVVHISNLSWNGIIGFSQADLHRDNYGLAISNRDYANTFYANGAHLAGVLKHPGRLTPDAYDRLRMSWESRYGGSGNAGKTAILEEGMDYSSIGLKPADASFAETKKLTTADISLLTGVPRFLLEDSDPTFNNGETITRLFTNFTILPLCENIESEFNRKLFFEDEAETMRVRFNLNQLLRADTEQRGRYIDNLMKWGIINRDEARKMEGWNPIEDGSGAAYFVPLNMVDPTKEEPGEQADPQEGDQLALFDNLNEN